MPSFIAPDRSFSLTTPTRGGVVLMRPRSVIQSSERWTFSLENLTSPRFAMRRVRGVESPRKFAQYVRTEGWNPVDARLRISNLPKLVRLVGKHSDFNDLQYREGVSPVPATTTIPAAFANIP